MADNNMKQIYQHGDAVWIESAEVTRVYSMMDASRLSTFFISLLLIIYGSFRSLNVEQENREKEKMKNKGSLFPTNTNSQSEQESGIQTMDGYQALFLPVGASLSLLVMFLFFDSLQIIFATCTTILATIAFAFLLLPMCQYVTRLFCNNNRVSLLGICERFTWAEILSFCLSSALVSVWIMTGHWLLMDALGMGVCVAFIALVRLPSLKVSTVLLLGLLLYDVFWVFFSSFLFSQNVMVKVATSKTDNPVSAFAKKLHITGLMRDAPKLSLPGKLVFPSAQRNGHFSMLGLGDIVMPGLLLCFVLRYDVYRRSHLTAPAEVGVATPVVIHSRITYFHCSLIGYFLGLLTATVSSEVFLAAQPALLYLVPFTLLPLLVMAYLKGDLRRMWHEPFQSIVMPKYIDV